MGVTLYALASGCMPFFGANDEIIVQRIKTSTFPMYHTFSRNLKDLVEHLLEKDPEKRFTLQQLKEHPWFSCKVELHGMTRVRSRSVVYHQGTGHGTHVPFLHLEECNKLKADEKIMVTPKGIISHREYVEQNNPPTEETNGSDPNSPPMVAISPSPSPETEELSGGSSMAENNHNHKESNKDRDREAKDRDNKDKMDTRDSKDRDALKKKTKWTSLLRLIGKNNNNNSGSPTKKDEHGHTGTGKPKITTPPALLVNQEMFASPYI